MRREEVRITHDGAAFLARCQVLNQMHGFLNALIFTLTNHAFVRAMVMEGLRRLRCVGEDEGMVTINGLPENVPEPN